MSDSNVALKEGFKQVCVWPGIVVKPDEVEDLVKFFKDELDTRVQYLESVTTGTDRDKNGRPDMSTGGRTDVLMAIHNDDIGKFAIARFQFGIRWLEDVYLNGQGNIYPARVAEYKCWEESTEVQEEA